MCALLVLSSVLVGVMVMCQIDAGQRCYEVTSEECNRWCLTHPFDATTLAVRPFYIHLALLTVCDSVFRALKLLMIP